MNKEEEKEQLSKKPWRVGQNCPPSVVAAAAMVTAPVAAQMWKPSQGEERIGCYCGSCKTVRNLDWWDESVASALL